MGYSARIYYHHTDAGGVVYYGAYLSLLEEARTAFLAEKGIVLGEYSDQGRFFVVVRQEVDYRFPARYADVVDIDTRVQEVGGVRIDLRHRIRNAAGTILAEARTVLAFVDASFKPRPLPEAVRRSLES